jgi:hypothetical protein
MRIAMPYLALALGVAPAYRAWADTATTGGVTQKDSPTAFNAPEPKPVLDWGTGEARSFWVPVWEIPTFQFLLNRFDHYVFDAASYPAPWTNLHTNLHRSWVIDNDKSSQPTSFSTPTRARSTRVSRAQRAWTSGRPRLTPSQAA